MYILPKHLDEKVARLHLQSLGVELTSLSKEQADYIGVPLEGECILAYSDNIQIVYNGFLNDYFRTFQAVSLPLLTQQLRLEVLLLNVFCRRFSS